MKILITGICGFVGSTIALELRKLNSHKGAKLEVFGIDNFCRAGSETNRQRLIKQGVSVAFGDARKASDFESLPTADWVIDASALPSVLAGVDGKSSSRQLIEHNLESTINILEYCKTRKAGFILLSTSRVYSINRLIDIPLKTKSTRFDYDSSIIHKIKGVSENGIDESFSTEAPISLYGGTKLASEALALEYCHAFDIPVWINRCGVLAGAGQFGRADQGIFSFWIHSWKQNQPLKYIGFDGEGRQVRDCLHPKDLIPLLLKQFAEPINTDKNRITNCSGGAVQSMSLQEISNWCENRFFKIPINHEPTQRQYDIPWVILDSSKANKDWGWVPHTPIEDILEEIAQHAESNPEWLDLSK